ncbi:MAG: Gfo/Idh/MocA family oxidoreductase [Pseudomonadota bacterium]|nr:Gfo/Idh/MocA family oxidoreductase [Pseudomonadota bacterium]
MTSTPIALLGAGPWGRTIASAISATPGVSLAAVVSSSAKTRRKFDLKIPIFEDWRRAIDATGAVGVVIALPPMHQSKYAVELIEHSMPVMLEKPMSDSIAGADAIRAAALKHGFTGLVNHLHLYAPAFRKLLISISNSTGPRTIQAVAGARGPCRSEWNPVWDWAGHDLAMALSAIAAEPLEIWAQPDAPIIEENLRYQNFRIDLSFRDGSRALLHLGNAFEHKIREFSISVGGSTGCYRETEQGEISLSIGGSDRNNICTGVESRPLNAALIAFAERIRSGGGIEDIEMGARVVRLIEAAERSIQVGMPISTRKGG